MRLHHTEHAQGRLAWSVWEGSSRSLVPVLALHGFTGSGTDFECLAETELAGHPWYCPHLPGHGETNWLDHEADWEPASLAEALALAWRQGNRPAPILLGYSLGGRLAMHIARQQPDLGRRLVLIGASPGLDEPTPRSQRLLLDAERARQLREEGLETFLEGWIRQPLIATQERIPMPWRSRWQERRRGNPAGGLALALERWSPGRLPSLWPELDRLKGPAMIAAGQHDPAYREVANRMAALMPDARPAIVPEAGHAAHVENPGAFAGLFDRWLDSIHVPHL